MSTITPTSDQLRYTLNNNFQVGDVVISSADQRMGTISEVNANGVATRVEVDWVDGTTSIVATNTLRKI